MGATNTWYCRSCQVTQYGSVSAVRPCKYCNHTMRLIDEGRFIEVAVDKPKAVVLSNEKGDTKSTTGHSTGDSWAYRILEDLCNKHKVFDEPTAVVSEKAPCDCGCDKSKKLKQQA